MHNVSEQFTGEPDHYVPHPRDWRALGVTWEVKEIPGMPGYLADQKGKVYSCWIQGCKLRRRGKPHRLKCSRSSNGYFLFGNRGERHTVHEAILTTFVGPRPKGMYGLHQNDIRDDNRIENLSWGTPTQNMADRKRNKGGNEGQRHGMSKLTDAEAKAILQGKGIVTYKRLAKVFSVSWGTIFRIWARRGWYHLPAHA